MKKILILGTLLVVLFCGGLPGQAGQPAEEKILRVCVWPEYIPEWVYDEFSQETGIAVAVEFYNYYAELLEKLNNPRWPAYDIMLLPSVSLSRLRKENLLAPLDKDKLPNMSHLFAEVQDKSFDLQNKYSVPYFWGLTGLVVRTNKADLDNVKKYAALWDPKYKGKVFLPDDPQVVLSLGLKACGYSCNDSDLRHLAEAVQKIEELMPQVGAVDNYVIGPYLDSGQVDLGLFFNDAVELSDEGAAPALKFVYPAEGPIMWIDSLAIAADAQNLDSAYTFLNFILRPDIALRSTIDIGAATPNKAAFAALPPELRDNETVYPPWDKVMGFEIEDDLGEPGLEFEKYWVKLLSQYGF